MSGVRLVEIEKRYGALVTLDGIDLEVREGEFVTLLGASGSGKTTCLRIVAGFVSPDSGRVMIGDTDVTHVPAHRRNTGMVFQQYALFPHLTVRENIAFGLRLRGCSARDIGTRVREALALVQLEALEGRYPNQLSGGQKQRVALARAVVIRPKILLLDEPLSALDLKLREELQVEIKRVQQMLGITTLFVTHDQNEALSMSDRVALMRDGRILQIAPPIELYERPADRYVASFVGKSNFLPVSVVSREAEGCIVATADGHRLTVGEGDAALQPGERRTLSFRPEAVRIGGDLPNRMSVIVEKATYVGNSWTLQCLWGRDRLTIAVPPGTAIPAEASTTEISWHPRHARLLPDEAGIPRAAN
jgi:putative spermidine/putrescine transport system ATP-binding protein